MRYCFDSARTDGPNVALPCAVEHDQRLIRRRELVLVLEILLLRQESSRRPTEKNNYKPLDTRTLNKMQRDGVVIRVLSLQKTTTMRPADRINRLVQKMDTKRTPT